MVKVASFSQSVYGRLCQVPKGRVTTYKALAIACGTRAYRAVGKILNDNPNIPTVPCHRVVMSDGRLGGYAHGAAAKQRLLEAEGITIIDGRIGEFERRCWLFDDGASQSCSF